MRNTGFRNHQSLTLSILGLSLACGIVAGDEPSGEEPVDLDPYYIVVTTRTPISPERSSPSVSFISLAEMENWQDRGLFDALSRESGLVLARNGSIGSAGSFFIRGTESRHSTVLLDGRRLNPGLANQFDLENLSLNNLESVQLMRGASSVNYGSSGIGGVVDMRTRSAFDAADIGRISAEFGSNNYRRGSAEFLYSQEAWAISFEASALSTDNERDNDEYSSVSLTQRLDYKLSDLLTLEFVGRYSDAEKENPGAVTNPSTFAFGETENWLLSPGFRYATDELTIHVFYSRSELVFEGVNDFGGAFAFKNTVDSDELSLQVDISLGEDVLLTGGASYRSDGPRSSDNPGFNTEFEQTGGFLQVIANLTDSLELRGGVRADHFSEYDDAVTGNLEAIYFVEELQASLFAKIANSYSPPTGQDLIFDADPATPVNPEESVSYELGLRKTFDNQMLEVEVVYFRNEIDDLIDFVAFVFDGFNVDEALTEGVETGFSYQVSEALSLRGSYTYLTAENEATGERLEKRPRHTLQASAKLLVTEDINLGISATSYIDRVGFAGAVLKDFTAVNLVGNWSISDDIDLFARVDNLLDKEFELSAGYPSLGRAGYIGAKLKF